MSGRLVARHGGGTPYRLASSKRVCRGQTDFRPKTMILRRHIRLLMQRGAAGRSRWAVHQVSSSPQLCGKTGRNTSPAVHR